MLKVNHEELKELVKIYYNTKIALMCWGKFGIGKSACIKQSAEELAKERAREFVEWNKITEEEKQKVFEYPEKYFTFVDIRLSEFDCSDIKGLPLFTDDKKAIDFKVPLWALLIEKDNSDGILFFDEINLAPPIVQSSCYKIIYDRVINNSRMNKNWLVMGAGNINEDRASIYEIAPPLKDRCGEVELIGADVDRWVNWAAKNNIDSRIIGFVNFKSGNLYVVNFDDNQKFTTYRGWERVNHLIKNIKEGDYSSLKLLTASAISEGVAGEFIAFCKIKEEINLEDIIKNPDKMEKIKEISMKYFIVSACAEKWKDKKIAFLDIINMSSALDRINNAEFVGLLLRLCASYNPDKFDKEYKTAYNSKDKKFYELIMKYQKYIVP